MNRKKYIWSNCLLEVLLGYETQKVVQIKSKPIGLIYRLVQFSIFVYIVLWVMWWERGYQASESVISGTSVKVLGGPLVNIAISNDTAYTYPVWDIADVVIPPQQNKGFFITTNVLVTPNQTQSFCAEAESVRIAHCRVDSDCQQGLMLNSMHGPFTGRCLKNVGRCEIFGWCPVEDDLFKSVNMSVFRAVLDYRVLITNTVRFRKYGIKRQNILSYMTPEYLRTCINDPIRDPLCPVFRIGDIFGGPLVDHTHILTHGGIIAISIDWTCDFDFAVDRCLPRYSYTRLYNDSDKSIDNDLEAQESGFSSGWSIYSSNQYERSGVKHRILTRSIGVQFFIHTTGKGWKFDLVTFTMNSGSGLALFGGATFFCDMILLYFLKKRKFYRRAKCDVLERTD